MPGVSMGWHSPCVGLLSSPIGPVEVRLLSPHGRLLCMACKFKSIGPPAHPTQSTHPPATASPLLQASPAPLLWLPPPGSALPPDLPGCLLRGAAGLVVLAAGGRLEGEGGLFWGVERAVGTAGLRPGR